jgi:hypothetical protein
VYLFVCLSVRVCARCDWLPGSWSFLLCIGVRGRGDNGLPPLSNSRGQLKLPLGDSLQSLDWPKVTSLLIITIVGGTLFSLKRKGLKGVKTTRTRNSLKAGTRAWFPTLPPCRSSKQIDELVASALSVFLTMLISRPSQELFNYLQTRTGW